MDDAAEASIPSADARAMVERLIAFNTVSRDSNLGLIEWARDYLAKLGARTRLTHDATGKKANLFATLGDSNRAGSDPVRSHRRGAGGRSELGHRSIQGGGAGRQTLRARLGRHEGLHRRRARQAPEVRRRPQCRAARRAAALCAELRRGGGLHRRARLDPGSRGERHPPAGCVVGEPTSMQPIIAHKGMNRFRCTVQRPRGAFELCHPRRQRHRVRGPPGGLHPPDRRSPGAIREARLRLHGPLYDAVDRA